MHNCTLQDLDAGVEQVGMERSQNERPDLGSARVVISGKEFRTERAFAVDNGFDDLMQRR